MRLFLFFLTVLGLSLTGTAQPYPTGATGKLNVVVLPVASAIDLDAAQRDKLQTVLLDWLTQNDVASLRTASGLVLAPALRVVDERGINPGLQSLLVLTAELTLTLRQADNGAVFSVITRRLQGSGRTHDLAVNALADQFDPADPALAGFLTKGKQKAVAYYTAECPRLMRQVTQWVAVRQYEQAFGLLLSIPQETTCYVEAQTRLTTVFGQYQGQICAGLLQTARTQLARRDFTAAMETVSQIDPLAPCATDTRALIDEAARETNADNQQRWRVLQQLFADYRDLETYRRQLLGNLLDRYYLAHPFYGTR